MGNRPPGNRQRKRAPAPVSVTHQPGWVRWLNDRPAPFYLLAAVLAVSLLVAFVLWLEERTLALVAGGAFAAMLGWWTWKVWRKWRDAEPMERVIGVVGGVLLLGGAAANFVRFLSNR